MSETIKTGSPTSGGQGVSSVEVPAYLPKQSIGQLLRNDLGFIPVLLTFIAIAIYFQIATSGLFLTPRNLTQLVLQTTTIGIIALGVTLVLLLGEIDLSAAAVSTLCSIIMGVLSERAGYPAFLSISIAILSGAIIGAINGVFIAILRVPSFIVTLAASIGYSGLLLYLLQGQATLIIRNKFILTIANNYLTDILGVGLPALVVLLYVGSQIYNYYRRQSNGLRTGPFWQLMAQSAAVVVIVGAIILLFENYLGVPQAVVILIGLILLVWLVLTRTSFGRYIYAVGGNAEASRRAGINVVAIRIAVFTLCSAIAAVAGVFAASRATAVASQIDPALLLQAIAAAVIGGVSLFGGRGSVWSIILGALIIGSLENGLDLLGQPTEVKLMAEGVVLLLAVTVDALVRRAQARSGR